MRERRIRFVALKAPFPTELMIRAPLMQQLCKPSDEQMEFPLLDRLSFQRFAGWRASSQIPERITIWTFKERPIRAGVSESIFNALCRQLARQGYIARGGQMVDASAVQVPKQSLGKEKRGLIKAGVR